ncbi:helix-turn-helix domain-containing protein [Nostoc sp. FACHB-110]|uniref:helix-turn-helix domain-containing protein n=1 Tax=Nostoc sp. FACHB-110 TaxID=2692834 RepID=UPI0016897FC1|nr:helix-turn-helix domain-containing protein [Nostoc sp. FACHB-110]MBD2438269.1 helix-turn-helix domain-containing protein [Nostoc sp. FACHB-110]
MSQLYTTPEAAEITGIKESTIRSWLRRHPEVFQIDVHVVVDEHGQKLWTEAGIEMLRSRRTAPKNATGNDAESDADDDAVDFLESLLETDAQALALEYWRQLPGRVLRRIKLMREQPTPEERVIVANSVRAALNAGTNHLLLPVYQPMLLGRNDDETE